MIGNRPQFIKAAAVTPRLRERGEEILVHTGQHYDINMSDVFFRDLGIPAPDVHLAVGSATHGRQTGAMLAGMDEVIYVVITAGSYDILCEVVSTGDEELLDLVTRRIRAVPGVRSTETFMYLKLAKQIYSWGVR